MPLVVLFQSPQSHPSSEKVLPFNGSFNFGSSQKLEEAKAGLWVHEKSVWRDVSSRNPLSDVQVHYHSEGASRYLSIRVFPILLTAYLSLQRNFVQYSFLLLIYRRVFTHSWSKGKQLKWPWCCFQNVDYFLWIAGHLEVVNITP